MTSYQWSIVTVGLSHTFSEINSNFGTNSQDFPTLAFNTHTGKVPWNFVTAFVLKNLEGCPYQKCRLTICSFIQTQHQHSKDFSLRFLTVITNPKPGFGQNVWDLETTGKCHHNVAREMISWLLRHRKSCGSWKSNNSYWSFIVSEIMCQHFEVGISEKKLLFWLWWYNCVCD